MSRYPKIYDGIPADYPLCLKADCPKADTCLHQLAFRRHEELGTYLSLINPSVCTGQNDCPRYACNEPVRLAKGFTNFKNKMYPDQYETFVSVLSCHFGRNPYFKRRRGDILLTPEDQEVIRTALDKAGVTRPMDFDEYIDTINWYT